MVFVYLEETKLFIELYEYTRPRFNFLLGKVIDCFKSQFNSLPEKVEVYEKDGNIRIYILNRNSHHLVLEFSLVEIFRELEMKKLRQEELHEAQEVFSNMGLQNQLWQFIQMNMSLLETNQFMWNYKLDREIEKIINLQLKNEEDDVIAKSQEHKSFEFKENRFRNFTIPQRNFRIRTVKHIKKDSNFYMQLKGIITKEVKRQIQRIYKKDDKVSKVYEGNFTVRIFYLNNPFQFNDKKLQLEIVETAERILLVIQIWNTKYILQYPYIKPKNYFGPNDFKYFSLFYSRGTISKDQFSSEICGKNSKHFTLKVSGTKHQSSQVLILCKRKKHLKSKRQGVSWELVRLDLLNRFVVRFKSNMISSRFVVIEHCNYNNCAAQKMFVNEKVDMLSVEEFQFKSFIFLGFYSVAFLIFIVFLGKFGEVFGRWRTSRKRKNNRLL